MVLDIILVQKWFAMSGTIITAGQTRNNLPNVHFDLPLSCRPDKCPPQSDVPTTNYGLSSPPWQFVRGLACHFDSQTFPSYTVSELSL